MTAADPIFAALAAVSLARRQHLAALDGLNEDDEAQMRRANAAADAESVAFEELARVIPTTLAGLRTLTETYAVEAEETERWASGAGYLRHIGRALRVRESGGPFSAPPEGESQADQPLVSPIPNAPFGPVAGLATIIPGPSDLAAAWRGLPAETRDRFGFLAFDMVFQAFVSGDAYAHEDRPVQDEALCGSAYDASCRRLSQIYTEIEAAFPSLFGPEGENPEWSDNRCQRPEEAA